MAVQRNAEPSTVASDMPQALTQPLTQIEIDQGVFDLYDEYCHGHIDRREFLLRAAAVTAGGLAMAQALLPRYVQAQTISFTDERIKGRYVTYPSPGGTSGTMRGYLVQPSGAGPFPAVLVIHENRGRTLRAAPRPRGFWRWPPTDCFPSADTPAMTMTAVPSRPASTKASCARTCSTARAS